MPYRRRTSTRRADRLTIAFGILLAVASVAVPLGLGISLIETTPLVSNMLNSGPRVPAAER